MKRLFSVLLSILVFSSAALAQQSDEAPRMSVRSFVMAENDNTANFYGTTVLDQNGDPCALIRVQTTQTGFAWDFGHMAPCKVEQKTGEIWVYVPYGVKRVTVRHAQLGTMTYEFPIPVAKARTYIMDLVAANVVVLVEQEITQQYVVFKVTPPDAIVELDGKVLETKNGAAKKFVRFGKYPYTVTAKDYYTFSGEVEVKDAQKSTVVNVELNAAFGTLTFSSDADLSGGVVFVDGEQMGTIPFSSDLRVSSGLHQLKIIKSGYKVFNGNFEIADGQVLKLSPELEPNFATVSVSTLEGAEIVANGVVLGKAPWAGRLEFDTYSFEIRKPSHRTVYSTLEFYEGAPTQIDLPQPIPIYGSLDIDCDDSIAKVTLDGAPIGETPCFIPKVLIGEHELALSSPGFATATRTVTVQEGKTEELSITLVKGYQPPREQQSATAASPAFVDLGLSVKWATCNLGASSPEEPGGYYQWAGLVDVTNRSNCLDLSRCPYHNGPDGTLGWTKYIPSNKSSYWSGPGGPDNKTVLDPEDDVAHVKLGGNWRMPTDAEWTELRSKCKWTWTTQNGVDGFRVTSKEPGYTDRSIFLPAAGFRLDKYLYYAGSGGYYWSSSLKTGGPRNAQLVCISSLGVLRYSYERCQGQSIRPVCGEGYKDETIEDGAIPFQYVEQKPSFMGGDADEFSKWVNSRLVYPKTAKENGIQGRVLLQITINEDGSVSTVKVLRGVDPSLDKEAVRVVSSSPKWEPGRHRDRAVSVTYTFPVVFQLR